GPDDADLEEHPVVRVGTGHRILLAQMKPALLGRPAVGTEDRLPRERRRPRKRMIIDEERIALAVELDRFAHRRIDHAWATEGCRRMSADVFQPIKRPHDRCRRFTHRRGIPQPPERRYSRRDRRDDANTNHLCHLTRAHIPRRERPSSSAIAFYGLITVPSRR